MFVITKSKDTNLPKRDTSEYAEMLRKSQYAAMMALTDPLMDGMSAGKKQKWHKKCVKEMQRVNRWLDMRGEKRAEQPEFEKNETIEQWARRLRDGIETVLPGI